MYINIIDDLIDRIIDDFYVTVITNNEKIKKLQKEINYIKSQKKMDDIMNDYIKSIPPSSISDITKENESYYIIHNIIKKYIVIYLFLSIGIFYKGSPDVFINNLIEFSRSQSQYSLKIDNFFNSESNALIIKLFYMCRNIVTLMEKDTIKKDHIDKQPYATETIAFLESIDESIIKLSFNLKSELLNGNTADQAHNIIKTIIIVLVYKENDKKNLHMMIEQLELDQGEYMFIDIIETVTDTINFDSIESLMTKKDLDSGLAYEIWEFISELNKGLKTITIDDKINILINSRLILPILDDFLLYHKDGEKYDKFTQIEKKKSDTKIKYIIGKIDTTTELYSKLYDKNPDMKETIMKNFPTSLLYRKAILKNDTEDVNIINKFLNQGKRNFQNNEYFNDLTYYKRYTYANFKDFHKYGFSHYFSKTITSVRAVNFENDDRFKQSNIFNRLQMRVGSKNTIGNIIGFVIPSNIRPIQCIRISDTVDIRKLSKKNKNGIDIFFKFLKKSVLNEEKHNSSVYWLFDIDIDKTPLESFDGQNGLSQQVVVKNMISEIYNRFIKEIYYQITEKINGLPHVGLHYIPKMVDYVKTNILKLSKMCDIDDELYYDIEKYILESDLFIFDVSDITSSDILYGLEGNIIKLPVQDEKTEIVSNIVVIDLSHVAETGELIKSIEVDGLCQHNISWENISALRSKNYSEYMERLYEFIRQYVVENTQHELICKSCGFYIDIKKYIQEGTFDSDRGFITFSMPMETNLEDMQEYSKYHFSIKIMDKNIEKIASSVGIPYYIGNSITVKWRRKGIIKNAIDMIMENNRILSKKHKERNEFKHKLYGISKNLSVLFAFEMENNIFQVSSKDKDQEQYKMIKRNNIMIYIMIYLILELNESQISFFTADKKSLCDIRVFDKVKNNLFGGIRIKKNNTDDTVPITDYTVLCYMIYMISCRIAKHRLWHSELSSEKNIHKLIPVVQKYVVNTTVDIINSILENSYQPSVYYIFEVFRIRFYNKLNTLFNNDKFYQSLLEQSTFKFITARKREHLKIISNDMLPEYIYGAPQWRTILPAKFFPSYRNRVEIKFDGISNLTNCPTGNFHKWSMSNGSVQCDLCKSIMKNLTHDQKESNQIIIEYKKLRLLNLINKLCNVMDTEYQLDYDISVMCKPNHDYSPTELDKFEKNIDTINAKRNTHAIEQSQLICAVDEKISSYVDQVVNKNLANMQKNVNADNPSKYIDDFIATLKGEIGNEIKGEFPVDLSNNIYIIDHDHTGYDLEGKQLVITDKDNKILYKTNHPHFKTNVIYYVDRSAGRIDVFYDAVTKKLLGYKESFKDYIDIKDTTKRLKVIYSIYNKIKLLGYVGEYMDISNEYQSIKNDFIDIDDREIYNIAVEHISRNRIESLKQIIVEFQRIFNRILYGHAFATKQSHVDELLKMNQNEQVMSDYFSSKMNYLVDKYVDKLKNIKIQEPSGKHMIFKHWKGISRGVFVGSFKDKNLNIDSKTIFADNISKHDQQSNSILYYIISEFGRLLSYNQSGYIRTNLCNFLVEFINEVFSKYNEDHLHSNMDIRRFMFVLSSTGFLMETSGHSKVKPQGFYDEYDDPDADEAPTPEDIEEKIDDVERIDALDVDMIADDIEEGFASEFDRYSELEFGI